MNKKVITILILSVSVLALIGLIYLFTRLNYQAPIATITTTTTIIHSEHPIQTVILEQKISYIPVQTVKTINNDNHILMPYYLPSKFKVYVEQLCRVYNVPIDIFCRTISAESQWHVICNSKNWNKAHTKILSIDKGLGQLNSKYLDYYSWMFNNGIVIDPDNPYVNLYISIKIIAWAYKFSHNWEDSLIIYNAGYTRWKNHEIPDSTIDYFNKVLYSLYLELK